MPFGRCGGMLEQSGRGEIIVDDHIGGLNAGQPFEGYQVRGARTGADQVDFTLGVIHVQSLSVLP